MKRALLIFIIFGFIITIICPSFGDDPYSYDIKQLLVAPAQDAKVAYEIPIEVKMLDVSEDANWYKVRISFYLGPINFVYTGWSYIPVGKILAERQAAQQIALINSK